MCAPYLNNKGWRGLWWVSLLLLISPFSLFAQEGERRVNLPESGELSTARIKNDVKAKVEALVGDLEDEIMGEIKGELTDLVTSSISSYLNVSPNSEVKSVIKTLKEGLSKEQKIVYQDYKVTYEWRKAHMDLTESLPDLYGNLHISERFKTAQQYLAACQQLKNSSILAGKVPDQVSQELKALNLADIADRVRAATNTTKEPVWMSTAQRIMTLKQASQDLDNRLTTIQSLHAQLQMAYSQSRKEKTDQQWVQSVTRPTSVYRQLLN